MYKSVYFDNAASSFPKPPCVLQAVKSCLEKNTANPGRSGHYMSAELAEKIYDVRKSVADFFGTEDGLVVFTQNATHAINLLFFGLLQSGDEVIISDVEHNSVLRPLTALSEKGVSFSVFESGENAVQNCEKLITEKTKLIFVSGASNVTGCSLPVKQLSALAKKNNILFGIDAAQSAGVIEHNMKSDSIDFICATAHKSLLGIQGCGFLAMKNETALTPLIYGGTGTESLKAAQPSILPERLESGTLPTPSIIALGASLAYLNKNKAAFVKKEESLYSHAYRLLSENKNITLYSSKTFCVPTISFNLCNMHSETVCSLLSGYGICTRGGYHCSFLVHKKLGTIEKGVCRISFSPFNTLSEIDYMCNIIHKIGR